MGFGEDRWFIVFKMNQRKMTSKDVSVKPHAVQLFIKITFKTHKKYKM